MMHFSCHIIELTSSGSTTHLRFQNTRQQQVATWLDIGTQTRLQVQQGPSQYVCYTDVELHGLLTGCYACHRVSPLYRQYQLLQVQKCHFCYRNVPFTAWLWTTQLSWSSRQCLCMGRYAESQTARIENMELHPKEWQDSLKRPNEAFGWTELTVHHTWCGVGLLMYMSGDIRVR